MSVTQARVLIIEDNDALRVMLFTILRHQPLGVDTAQSADEAMEKVRTCDYALIIIDMDLAAGESLSFLETFREEGIFHEHLATAIRDDFVATLDPLSLDVTARFNSRGGIAIAATSSYDASAAGREN